MSRSLAATAALAAVLTIVLTALLSVLGASAVAAGLAFPATGHDEKRAQTGQQQALAGASVPSGEKARESARVLQCLYGGERSQYREHQRRNAPQKPDHATLRRGAGDQLQWVEPGGCFLAPPRLAPAENYTDVERAVTHRTYRTFDGRAPPLP